MGLGLPELLTQSAYDIAQSKEPFVDVNSWKRKKGARSNREMGGVVRGVELQKREVRDIYVPYLQNAQEQRSSSSTFFPSDDDNDDDVFTSVISHTSPSTKEKFRWTSIKCFHNEFNCRKENRTIVSANNASSNHGQSDNKTTTTTNKNKNNHFFS